MKWIVLLLVCVSCASKPTLYPNQKLKTIGKKAAQKDIDALHGYTLETGLNHEKILSNHLTLFDGHINCLCRIRLRS